jgi:Ca2+-binding EF-hand superfamily protein
MRTFTIAALLLGMAGIASAQAKNAPAGGQDLFFFSKNGPIFIRVQVEIDGKSIHDVYRDYLKKFVAYYDRDGDGMLNAQELKYLPNGYNLTTLFRNGYGFFNPGQSLKLADFNKVENDKVSLDELAAYLEKHQISPFQTGPVYGGYGAPGGGNFYLVPAGGPGKGAASNALFKILDTDGDGKLSKKEIQAARNALKKYDLNDDEMITVAELTGSQTGGGFGNGVIVVAPQPLPGMPGPKNQTPVPLHLVTPGALTQTASQLMARYDKNNDAKLDLAESGLDQATFNKLDRNQDGFLTLTEVVHWMEIVEPVKVTIRIGNTNGQPQVSVQTPWAKLPKGVQVAKAGAGHSYLLFEDAKLSFHGMPKPQQMMMAKFAGSNSYLVNLFNMVSQGKDSVELKDLQNLQYKPLASIFEMVDRNADGKLTMAELEEYFNLLEAAKLSYASVKLSEEGQDLFQILDLNKDGKLSAYELNHAWETLSVLDRNQDGFITPDEFSQQYVFTVGQGQAPYNGGGGGFPVIVNDPGMLKPPPAPKATGKAGPLWFQKMDTNGDGFVSEREFLGPRELFLKMDTNHDGLIDAEEARQAEAWFAKKSK